MEETVLTNTIETINKISDTSLVEFYKIFGEKNLRRIFEKRSIIAQLLMENPGTFKMLEIIYSNKKLFDPFDRYLSESLPAEALRNRLRAVIFYLQKKLRELANKENVKVVNLGCGSGRDIITAMASNLTKLNSICVDCVDIDPEALITARKLALEKRIVSNFNFVLGNFLSLPYKKEIDLGLLIGVLCGLEKEKCIIILRKIKSYFKKSGILIASNVSTEMVKQEPVFSKLILEKIIGWKLVFKTLNDLEEIFKKAGYRLIDVFYDEPTRFHIMLVGTPIV